MAGFMSVLGNSNAEAEPLDLINVQPTGLKPSPGRCGIKIIISAGFDASMDVLFDRELEPAMFTRL